MTMYRPTGGYFFSWTQCRLHFNDVADLTSVIKIRLEKKLSLASGLSTSLKVIGTDTYRSAIYDFLLTFHSNHGPISYRFRDKWRFQSKIAKFSHPPRVFWAPAEWVPFEIGYRGSGSKTRMMGLPGRQISLTIFSAVCMDVERFADQPHLSLGQFRQALKAH